MPAPRLHLSGRPTLALADGEPVALERKDAAWLALLALDGPRARDTLAAWLWPEVPRKTANTSLRQRIFRLRKRVGHELVQAGATVSLLPAVALAEDDGSAELLAGFDYADCPEFADWLRRQRELRRGRRVEALAAAATHHEAAGDLAAAIAAAQALVAEDPLSEHAHRRLMQLHHLRGDRAAAIGVFERLERALKDELGTPPGAQTQALLALVERAAAPAAPRHAPVPAGLGRPPRLVGRDAELAALAQAWEAGRIFLVLGEAGMGKTRLLQDFAAARAGGAPLRVAARPGDAGVPFALLARLLRALGERVPVAVPDGERRELARVLPELGLQVAGEGQRLLLRHAVEAWLADAAARGVDALLVDDLHFADDASLDMLQAVAASERLHTLRLGLAQRGGEGSAAARALAQGLEDTQRLQPVWLAPLDEAAMRALVESLALPALDAAALAPRLVRHCGGNPLFALETLKDLLIDGGSGRDALPRPATVGTLIERRVRQLSPPALALARVAALAGADFSIALAERVLATPALALADAWAELESAQVLAGAAFAHDLVADAVVRSVPVEIARHVHGGVAAFLQQAAADAPRVAHHWEHAGRPREAAQAWRLAATQAFSTGRRAEQAGFLERAAACFDRAGLAAEALAARAALLDPLASTRGVDAVLALSDELLAQAGDATARALVLLGRGKALLWAGRFAQAGEAAAEVLAADAACTPTLLVEAAGVAGRALAGQGRASAAVALLQAQAARAQGLPEDTVRLGYLGNLAAVLTYANRRRDSREAAEQQVALARRLGRHDELREGLASVSIACAALGELDRAIARARELHLLEQSLGDELAERWVHDSALGWYLVGAGRYAESMDLLQAARERLLALMPGTPFTSLAGCMLGELYCALGQPARALPLVSTLDERHPGFLRGRQLWVQARAGRSLGQDAGERLARALALCEGESGLPMRLLARLEATLDEPAASAVAACDEVEQAANGADAPVMARLAALRRVQARLRAGDVAQCAAEAHALLADPAPAAGPAIHPPELWLACAQAFEASGDRAACADAARAGLAWVDGLALPQVPAAFRESFLHRHPVHVALRVLAGRVTRG